MKNPYIYIANEHSGKEGIVLATLVATRGSTPQKPGFSAVFNSNGLIYGTIGGGVLEGRVTEIATGASKSGISGIYHFDLDNDIDHRNEAICGGTADVIVDADPGLCLDLFREAERLLARNVPCVIVTFIREFTGNQVTIDRDLYYTEMDGERAGSLKPDLKGEAEKLLSQRTKDECRLLEADTEGDELKRMIFLEPLFPVPRLVIAGAGHIGKALCHLGSRLDFEVTVIDDRPEYANSDNLPEADSIIVGDIGNVLAELQKDKNTYIVIVTRGHSDDSDALKACIKSNPAYIGMIGSRTKIAKMHRNFIENGWASEDEWSSVFAPVGVEIQSQTVEEIAISIAAQLVSVRNDVR